MLSGVAGACIEDNQRSSGAWVVVLDPTDRPGTAWCMVYGGTIRASQRQQSGVWAASDTASYPGHTPHTAATRGLHRKPLSPAIITNTGRLDTDLSLCRRTRPCYAVS